jgi:hypothetical protein
VAASVAPATQAVHDTAAVASAPTTLGGGLNPVDPTILKGVTLGRLLKSDEVPPLPRQDLTPHGVGVSFNAQA